jgi:glycerophosphoryl diester phosphodiesterase
MATLLEALHQQSTMVFGHRGARAYAPMNTIPSFLLALEQGAAGIELDVRMTIDHHLVIMHDSTVDRTTDGHGEVSSLTLRQIKSLDAGRWFDSRFEGVRIPTLTEVFEAIGPTALIDIEIKAEKITRQRIERAVAQTINRYGLRDRVMVTSFNPLVLRRFRKEMPSIMLGFLHTEERPFFLQSGEFAFEGDAPEWILVTPRYMEWAKAQGLAVTTWTVNDPAKAVELRDLGVNVIITDQPDTILQALENN